MFVLLPLYLASPAVETLMLAKTQQQHQPQEGIGSIGLANVLSVIQNTSHMPK